ncbi:MAG: patatin-like phospholipase family protein [Fluviicola sp.]|nr:patatin-like phospholipase family protein [Fluviicola sp.]
MKHLIFSLFLCLSSSLLGQGVGVVLSGGGASGFAHIGVLKALEENGIPIDYITGTSAGALVGSMYAIGFSPEEIEAYVLSNKFQLMSMGEIERRHEFLLREDDPNASLISFSFSGDSIFQKSLPTNFIRPELLDYEMLKLLGRTSAARYNNFDSLFIPFRCVASDIAGKKGDVFSKGNLNQAVRASMTFPFYVNPIRINGILYFDGGLYNNFPADVMYHNFTTDYIIGSNVSYNAAPPSDDDLISQLTNMLVTPTNFNLPCESGILIQPKSSVQTFEFDEVGKAILEGYNSTLLMIDSIKLLIPYRISKDSLNAKRQAFRKLIPEFTISEVSTLNEKGEDESYVRKSILKNTKNQVISERLFEKRYFRTYATPELKYLFPTLELKKDSTYKLNLEVKRSKAFKAEIGGIVSSRAINTGFVQLSYLRLGRLASTVKVNSYFGKFYGSGKAQVNINLPSYYPVSISGYMTLNRFDYFRSFATFFEDVKPSFLVQNETFAGVQVKLPIFNNSKNVFDYRHIELEDKYYQTTNFTNKDTADVTRFSGDALTLELEQNSLNRKQLASSGTMIHFKAKYVAGREHSIAGSTGTDDYDYRKNHQWIQVSAAFQSYVVSRKMFSVGLHANTLITSQSLFKNYTATILSLSSYEPLPDMQTYFLPEYRASQFVGGGINLIFTPRKNFDLRFDGYYFQPFKQLGINADGTFGYSKPFKGEKTAAALSGIYHSPIGPLRLTLNYFPAQAKPFLFQFTFGYIIFNERAIR